MLAYSDFFLLAYFIAHGQKKWRGRLEINHIHPLYLQLAYTQDFLELHYCLKGNYHLDFCKWVDHLFI